MAPVRHAKAPVTGLSNILSSAEKTRASKPAMERRRRERINKSLDELKSMLIDALRKDSTCHSKLEKADILEMTVQYIKTMRVNGPGVENSSRFQSGYNCAKSQVLRYLSTPQGVLIPEESKSNLLCHLNQGLPKSLPVPGQVPANFYSGVISPNSTHVPQIPNISQTQIVPDQNTQSFTKVIPASPNPQSILQAQQNLHRINMQILAQQNNLAKFMHTGGPGMQVLLPGQMSNSAKIPGVGNLHGNVISPGQISPTGSDTTSHDAQMKLYNGNLGNLTAMHQMINQNPSRQNVKQGSDGESHSSRNSDRSCSSPDVLSVGSVEEQIVKQCWRPW